jgi:hypothetical protein
MPEKLCAKGSLSYFPGISLINAELKLILLFAACVTAHNAELGGVAGSKLCDFGKCALHRDA